MQEPDRAIAERLHAIIKASVRTLSVCRQLDVQRGNREPTLPERTPL
jgi:hypothetical protein